MEGIMAKKRNSSYLPGKRSKLWLKVKVHHTEECLVIGYTRGRGDREKYFGALHLGQYEDEILHYRGKVGTGFTDAMMAELSEQLVLQPEIQKPVPNKVVNEKESVWIEPRIIVEVSYATITSDGIFREGVFNRLRPDLYVS